MKTVSNSNSCRRSGPLPFLQILLKSVDITWCLRIVMLLVLSVPYDKSPGVKVLMTNGYTEKLYLQSDVYSMYFKALKAFFIHIIPNVFCVYSGTVFPSVGCLWIKTFTIPYAHTHILTWVIHCFMKGVGVIRYIPISLISILLRCLCCLSPFKT